MCVCAHACRSSTTSTVSRMKLSTKGRGSLQGFHVRGLGIAGCNQYDAGGLNIVCNQVMYVLGPLGVLAIGTFFIAIEC